MRTVKIIKQLPKLLCFILLSWTTIAIAEDPLLTITMEEWTGGRSGPLKIFAPMGPSGVAGTELADLDTGFWATADWSSICASNVSLAGGHAEGWLLGPIDDIPTIRAWHPTATLFYGVVVGDGSFFPASLGTGTRNPCGGGSSDIAFGILYIFLEPNATFFDGRYRVGDALYITELSEAGNWYRLYHPTPLF